MIIGTRRRVRALSAAASTSVVSTPTGCVLSAAASTSLVFTLILCTLSVVASACLLSTLAPCAFAQPSGEAAGQWSTLEGDEIAVLHHPDDEQYAKRVRSIYEARASSIASSMGLRALSPLRVLIASSDEEFSELSYYGAPDWGVGCALPRRGLVILKSPRIVSYPLQMEAVFEHELAHIAAGRVLRGVAVPRWFDEGLAQAVAGEWRMSQSGALAGAAASGKLPPLSSLDGAFPEGREAAAVAYTMSFQAVRLMLELSGASEAGELVRAVGAEGDFDVALLTMTGLTRDEFDSEYARFIARRFTWATILHDTRWFFLGAAALLVAGAVVRLRRARARMKAWDDEEKRTGARRPGAKSDDTRWS